jgi:ribosomal protein L23
VDSRANKILVKREVEVKHGVHVIAVTMAPVRVKPSRFRGKVTAFKNAKKATVRLKDGERIDTA